MAVSASNPGLDWGWHLDADCLALADLLNATHLANPQSLVRELAAPSALALAQVQNADGHAPCPRCAYGPVLTQLGGLVTARGYHVLVCGSHPLAPAHPCMMCAALTAHAQAGGVYLAAMEGDRVALLGAGRLSTAHWPLLARMRLVSRNTTARGPVTPARWAAAAAVHVPFTGWARALAAAAGLYAAPQATPGPRAARGPGTSNNRGPR